MIKKTWFIVTICIIIVIGILIFWKSLIWTPKLSISEDSWDFGRVKKVERVKHIFIIKNLGNVDLTLKAWPSCHRCIGPTLTATIIPPKGKAELIVELLIIKEGLNEAYVMLETNDPNQPAKKITAKAMVIK